MATPLSYRQQGLAPSDPESMFKRLLLLLVVLAAAAAGAALWWLQHPLKLAHDEVEVSDRKSVG